MDSDIKTILNKTYCKGCLSCDRIVQVITNAEIKQTYFTIVEEKPPTPGALILCWECVANIVRLISFRRQVKAAHDVLLKHMVSPADITSLSKLTIVRNNIEISINDTLELNKFTPNIKRENSLTKVYWTNSEETQSNVSYRQLEDYNIRIESVRHVEKIEDVLPSDTERGDETFIKIEVDGSLNDVEENSVDDAFQHHNEDNVKKIVVELEPINVEKTEVKSKRNKKVEGEFNDSDEEPLEKKKKTEKERKDKREKNEDQVSDKKTNKKSDEKREEPAGVVSNPRVIKKLKQLNVGEGQVEMVILSWEEVEEERKKAMSSVVFTRHEYRCQDCIVGFNHKFKLVNHMKKHDPSAGEHVCDVCQVRCRDTQALVVHKRKHRVRWRCCTCGATWSCAAVAADHVTRDHHAPPPTHTCTVCGHVEPSWGKLRIHKKTHAEKQKCEICEKTFRDRDALRIHLFTHKGEKEYSCPRCDKKFLLKKGLEVHLVSHNESEQLYCHQCDMNFKNRMTFNHHMKHNLKHIDPAKLKYACGSCDKKFAKARRLEEHEYAVHLKITPIRCTLPGCDFACSSRPVLRTHIRMVHRNKRAQRNHVCDTCGKAYPTKKILEGHLRSHTGERPFACPLCPSTFGYEGALYTHNKLVHLKVKKSRAPTRPLRAAKPTLDMP